MMCETWRELPCPTLDVAFTLSHSRIPDAKCLPLHHAVPIDCIRRMHICVASRHATACKINSQH